MTTQANQPFRVNFLNGVYFGALRDRKCHGSGVFSWDNGEFYFGEWENNKMDGEGIFFFAYGGVLKGQFYRNKINGAAILKFPNGDVYEGFWRHGKLDGKCFKYFLADKTWALCIYENGIYRKCLNQGKGTPNINFEEKLTDKIEMALYQNPGQNICVLPFVDGGKFYGLVENETANGLGLTSNASGTSEYGFYSDGVLDGLGRISFQQGNFYDGELQKGELQGEGFFYKKDTNRWIFGKFEQGRCTSVLEKGQGVPLDELHIWKRKYRGYKNHIQTYILNNVFYVPTLEDPRNAKRRPSERFVGLKKFRSNNQTINDTQIIIDINEVLQTHSNAPALNPMSPHDDNPLNSAFKRENDFREAGNEGFELPSPTEESSPSPTKKQKDEEKGGNEIAKLSMRIQGNIEKNWDVLSSTAQQLTSEDLESTKRLSIDKTATPTKAGKNKKKSTKGKGLKRSSTAEPTEEEGNSERRLTTQGDEREEKLQPLSQAIFEKIRQAEEGKEEDGAQRGEGQEGDQETGRFMGQGLGTKIKLQEHLRRLSEGGLLEKIPEDTLELDFKRDSHNSSIHKEKKQTPSQSLDESGDRNLLRNLSEKNLQGNFLLSQSESRADVVSQLQIPDKKEGDEVSFGGSGSLAFLSSHRKQPRDEEPKEVEKQEQPENENPVEGSVVGRSVSSYVLNGEEVANSMNALRKNTLDEGYKSVELEHGDAELKKEEERQVEGEQNEEELMRERGGDVLTFGRPDEQLKFGSGAGSLISPRTEGLFSDTQDFGFENRVMQQLREAKEGKTVNVEDQNTISPGSYSERKRDDQETEVGTTNQLRGSSSLKDITRFEEEAKKASPLGTARTEEPAVEQEQNKAATDTAANAAFDIESILKEAREYKLQMETGPQVGAPQMTTGVTDLTQTLTSPTQFVFQSPVKTDLLLASGKVQTDSDEVFYTGRSEIENEGKVGYIAGTTALDTLIGKERTEVEKRSLFTTPERVDRGDRGQAGGFSSPNLDDYSRGRDICKSLDADFRRRRYDSQGHGTMTDRTHARQSSEDLKRLYRNGINTEISCLEMRASELAQSYSSRKASLPNTITKTEPAFSSFSSPYAKGDEEYVSVKKLLNKDVNHSPGVWSKASEPVNQDEYNYSLKTEENLPEEGGFGFSKEDLRIRKILEEAKSNFVKESSGAESGNLPTEQNVILTSYRSREGDDHVDILAAGNKEKKTSEISAPGKSQQYDFKLPLGSVTKKEGLPPSSKEEIVAHVYKSISGELDNLFNSSIQPSHKKASSIDMGGRKSRAESNEIRYRDATSLGNIGGIGVQTYDKKPWETQNSSSSYTLLQVTPVENDIPMTQSHLPVRAPSSGTFEKTYQQPLQSSGYSQGKLSAVGQPENRTELVGSFQENAFENLKPISERKFRECHVEKPKSSGASGSLGASALPVLFTKLLDDYKKETETPNKSTAFSGQNTGVSKGLTFETPSSYKNTTNKNFPQSHQWSQSSTMKDYNSPTMDTLSYKGGLTSQNNWNSSNPKFQSEIENVYKNISGEVDKLFNQTLSKYDTKGKATGIAQEGLNKHAAWNHHYSSGEMEKKNNHTIQKEAERKRSTSPATKNFQDDVLIPKFGTPSTVTILKHEGSRTDSVSPPLVYPERQQSYQSSAYPTEPARNLFPWENTSSQGSKSPVYQTPERAKKTGNEVENYYTPGESQKKMFLTPITPLAKIEELKDDASATSSVIDSHREETVGSLGSLVSDKMQMNRNVPYSFSQNKSKLLPEIREISPIRENKKDGKCLNVPVMMCLDVRSEEDSVRPVSDGISKTAKLTPKSFDYFYLFTSMNQKSSH